MVEGKYEMVGGQVVNVKFLCQSTHKTGKYSEKFSLGAAARSSYESSNKYLALNRFTNLNILLINHAGNSSQNWKTVAIQTLTVRPFINTFGKMRSKWLANEQAIWFCHRFLLTALI